MKPIDYHTHGINGLVMDAAGPHPEFAGDQEPEAYNRRAAKVAEATKKADGMAEAAIHGAGFTKYTDSKHRKANEEALKLAGKPGSSMPPQPMGNQSKPKPADKEPDSEKTTVAEQEPDASVSRFDINEALRSGKSIGQYQEEVANAFRSEEISEPEWDRLMNQVPASEWKNWNTAQENTGILGYSRTGKKLVYGKVEPPAVENGRIVQEVGGYKTTPDEIGSLTHYIAEKMKRGEDLPGIEDKAMKAVFDEVMHHRNQGDHIDEAMRKAGFDEPKLRMAFRKKFAQKIINGEGRPPEKPISDARKAAMKKAADRPALEVPAPAENSAAKSGDQMGLFGEVSNTKKDKSPTLKTPEPETKGKQSALFDTKGDKDQMLMFDDGVATEDRLMKTPEAEDNAGPIPLRERAKFADDMAKQGKSQQEIEDAMRKRNIAISDAKRHAARAMSEFGSKADSNTKSDPEPEVKPELPSEKATDAKDSALDAGKSPREAAIIAQKQTDADYEFARSSEVRNAGEDLKGSARHKVNEWKGLAEAEKDGTAAEFMTRKGLFKIEPHNLMATISDTNAMSHLIAHSAISAFPESPGSYPASYEKYRETYRDRAGNSLGPATSPETLRKQYHDAYSAIKKKAEELATTESDPRLVAKGIAIEAKRQINIARGLPPDASGVGTLSAKDPYNPVANGLVPLANRAGGGGRKKTDLMNRVLEVAKHSHDKYGAAPSRDHLKMIKEHVLDLMDGKSMNKTFGLESKAVKRFDPSSAYVKHASRKGGRDLASVTSDPNKATKHMVETMGMRGVQWGNSVTDDERKHHAAKAVEALTDLADVTGLHPKDIALDGKLGLAIGARGKGNASAHYEPGTQVINLTRASGVGALAHEWGHAFDHMLNDYSNGQRGNYMSGTFGHSSSDSKGEIRQAYKKWWDNSSKYRVRLSDYLRQQVREGGMSANKANEYWNSSHEIFARTFERHVQHKLESSGKQNTYLAGLGDDHPLWPNSEESASMADSFDGILSAYRKHKHGTTEVVKFSARDIAKSFGPAVGMNPAVVAFWVGRESSESSRLNDDRLGESVKYAAEYESRKRSRVIVDRYSADWDEGKHPRDNQGRFSEVGDSFTALPHRGLEPQLMNIHEASDSHFKVSNQFGMTAKIPKESLQHFRADLTGDISYLQDKGSSGNESVDAIINGRGKMIGKGNDSVVWDSGNSIVKSSTTVPYHAVGGGEHVTPTIARKRANEQYAIYEKLKQAGVKGMPEQTKIEHGDRVFTVQEKLSIPEKFSPEQARQAKDLIESLHDAGYAFNDELQFGTDASGNMKFFDFGTVAKNDPAWGIYQDDQAMDRSKLRRLYENAGIENELLDPPHIAAKNAGMLVAQLEKRRIRGGDLDKKEALMLANAATALEKGGAEDAYTFVSAVQAGLSLQEAAEFVAGHDHDEHLTDMLKTLSFRFKELKKYVQPETVKNSSREDRSQLALFADLLPAEIVRYEYRSPAKRAQDLRAVARNRKSQSQWNPAEHPRTPAGSDRGGEFTSGNQATGNRPGGSLPAHQLKAAQATTAQGWVDAMNEGRTGAGGQSAATNQSRPTPGSAPQSSKRRELAALPTIERGHYLHHSSLDRGTQDRLLEWNGRMNKVLAPIGIQRGQAHTEEARAAAEESGWARVDKNAVRSLLEEMNQLDHSTTLPNGMKIADYVNANGIIPRELAERLDSGSRFFDPEKMRGKFNQPQAEKHPEEKAKQEFATAIREQRQSMLADPEKRAAIEKAMGLAPSREQPAVIPAPESNPATGAPNPKQSIPGSQPAPKPAKPANPEPAAGMSRIADNRLNQVIKETVGENPEAVKYFKGIAIEAHKQIKDEAENHNDALRQISSFFGKHLGSMAANFTKGVDPSKIKGFDELIDHAVREYPQVLSRMMGDSSAGGPEDALVAAIREGIRPVPQPYDESVISRAVDLAGQNFFDSLDQTEDEPGDESEDWAANELESEAVPFSARRDELVAAIVRYWMKDDSGAMNARELAEHGAMLERYGAQMEFDWDEAAHPRAPKGSGNGGEFVKNADSKTKPKRILPDGYVEQPRAKAGGETSSVDGVFYKGGWIMPVHGLFSGQEKPPAKPKRQDGESAAVKEDQDKGPKQVRERSKSEVEADRERIERQRQWDELQSGPIKELFGWIGDRPNGKAFKDSPGHKFWAPMAERLGISGVEELTKFMKSKTLDRERRERTAPMYSNVKRAMIDTDEQVQSYLENIEWQLANDQHFHTKKHLKAVPNSRVGEVWLGQFIGNSTMQEKLALNTKLKELLS